MRASVNFATFEESKAPNYCSRTNLSARRRDAEVELTVAHHLGGLVGAVAGRMPNSHGDTLAQTQKSKWHKSAVRAQLAYPGFVSPSSGPPRRRGATWRGGGLKSAPASNASPHHRPESAKELRPFDLAYYVVSPDGETTTLLALLAISYQLL